MLTDLLIALQNTPAAVMLRSSPAALHLLGAANLVSCGALAGLLVLPAGRAASGRAGLAAFASIALACGSALFLAEPFRYASWAQGGVEAALLALAFARLRLRTPPARVRPA